MKMTRILGLVICLLFITNLQAQTMYEYWKCEYEYNDADMTASVKLWNGAIGSNGYPGMSWAGFDEGSNILVIPNSAVNPENGLTYTVTILKKGSTDLGWSVKESSSNPQYFNQPIKVYIPKTIKSIESQVFKRGTPASVQNGDAATGDFWFYFEDERTEQYANEYSMKMMGHPAFNNFEGVEDIAEAFAEDWFVRSQRYSLGWTGSWKVVRFNSEDTDITVEVPSNESTGEVNILLNDNVITEISFPSWIRITTNNFRSASESVYIDYDFVLSYELEANTGAEREGEIVLTDNNDVKKTIIIKQAAGQGNNIQNVSVSNVNYRIENGVIYFNGAVKDIRLYDVNL